MGSIKVDMEAQVKEKKLELLRKYRELREVDIDLKERLAEEERMIEEARRMNAILPKLSEQELEYLYFAPHYHCNVKLGILEQPHCPRSAIEEALKSCRPLSHRLVIFHPKTTIEDLETLLERFETTEWRNLVKSAIDLKSGFMKAN